MDGRYQFVKVLHQEQAWNEPVKQMNALEDMSYSTMQLCQLWSSWDRFSVKQKWVWTTFIGLFWQIPKWPISPPLCTLDGNNDGLILGQVHIWLTWQQLASRSGNDEADLTKKCTWLTHQGPLKQGYYEMVWIPVNHPKTPTCFHTFQRHKKFIINLVARSRCTKCCDAR